MHTKLFIIATVAALSLATTAFAESEGGTAQPLTAQPLIAQSLTGHSVASAPLNATGVHDHGAGKAHAISDDTVHPVLGENGPVQTANSLQKHGAVSATA